MILASLTTTAPNGPPQPFSTDSIASRVASWANCFLYSLLSMSGLLIGFCGWVCFGGLGCAAESASFSFADARIIFANFQELFGGKKDRQMPTDHLTRFDR